MSLRIRQDGTIWCAALTEPMEGDLYIDDNWHYSLTAETAVIVTHAMPKHVEQGGQWWWRWEAPEDCDFRMLNIGEV